MDVGDDRRSGWYAVGGAIAVVGITLLTAAWAKNPPSAAGQIIGFFVTFGGLLAILAAMFQLPSRLWRLLTRADAIVPISVEPLVQGNRMELQVTNTGSDPAKFAASVIDVEPRPRGVPTQWALPWSRSSAEMQKIGPNGDKWRVFLGEAGIRHCEGDGQLTGDIKLKRFGLNDVEFKYENTAECERRVPITVFVRVTPDEPPARYLDRKFRIALEANSPSGAAIPQVVDASARRAVRSALKAPPLHITITIGALAAIAIGAVVVMWPAAAASPRPSRLIPVQILAGSENLPFIDDPQVQQIFAQHHLDVQATGAGSLQMVDLDQSRYDAFLPSSQLAASRIQLGGQPDPDIQVFESPLAIATYQPVAACLRQHAIASQARDGIWTFDVGACLRAVAAGRSWSSCGSAVRPLSGRILLSTTNPACSNSGAMFVADASDVANHGIVVSSPATARQVGRELAPLLAEQGDMDSTTENLFQDYVTNGMGSVQMAVVYESVFLGEEITDPAAMTRKMVLMYPSPTIRSYRTFVWRDQLGEELGNLLRSNRALQDLAQDKYGFRISNPGIFAKEMSRHRIFGKPIIVPQSLSTADAPVPTLLQDLIDAADPTLSC